MPPPSSTRSRGLSFLGALSLVSIVGVLVLVSLPRLRDFALHANALDARSTLEFLAQELERHPEEGALDRLVASPRLRHALADLEPFPGGRLRRHGYLFASVPWASRPTVSRRGVAVEAAVGASTSAPVPRALVAWPWAPGRTGTRGYLRTPDGKLWFRPLLDPRAGGPDLDAVRFATSPGWRRLSEP